MDLLNPQKLPLPSLRAIAVQHASVKKWESKFVPVNTGNQDLKTEHFPHQGQGKLTLCRNDGKWPFQAFYESIIFGKGIRQQRFLFYISR
jgi:hypothetical protein